MRDIPLVLLACTPDAGATAKHALGSSITYRVAFSVREAMSKVSPDIDLVLTNVGFDGSRMFDLVRELRSPERKRTIPIICFRQRPLTDAMHHAIDLSLHEFERTSFVDLHELSKEGGKPRALYALREAVVEELCDRSRKPFSSRR